MIEKTSNTMTKKYILSKLKSLPRATLMQIAKQNNSKMTKDNLLNHLGNKTKTELMIVLNNYMRTGSGVNDHTSPNYEDFSSYSRASHRVYDEDDYNYNENDYNNITILKNKL